MSLVVIDDVSKFTPVDFLRPNEFEASMSLYVVLKSGSLDFPLIPLSLRLDFKGSSDQFEPQMEENWSFRCPFSSCFL